MTWKIAITHNFANRKTEFYLFDNYRGTDRVVLQTAVIDVPPGAMVDPSISMDDREARQFMQEMMDQLWLEGLRPSSPSVKDCEREVAAVRAHLADMRRLVFKDPPFDGDHG